MTQNFLFSLSAVVALIPAICAGLRRQPARDLLFWATLAVAVAGPLAWTTVQMPYAWKTGLSAALWVTVSTTVALFALLAAVTSQTWKLTPLIISYLVVLAILALLWQHGPERALHGAAGPWVVIHIMVSVVTYSLVTIAAAAALAASLQENALKQKRPTPLTKRLPSVADCEYLLVRLLIASEAVLALGLATGMGTLYAEQGALIMIDHKIVLTITAFVVIGGLLIAHFASGTRGRVVSRWVLVAYLLMTLGYPGVKFVTDVLMA